MNTEVNIKCIADLTEREIDVSSNDYLLEFPSPDRLEEESIKYDLIIPPLLIVVNKRYKPIFMKTIISKQIKKWGKVKLSLVITEYLNDYSLFKFLLFLKKRYLGLNPVEKSMFLYRFIGIIGDSIYKDLEIPKNTKSIEGYRNLLSASAKIKNHLVSGEIDEFSLFEIFYLFEKKYWDEIEDFIIKLKIGSKKRAEVVNMLYDIIQRDNLSLDMLIHSEEIRLIMNKKIDLPQKGEKIFELLYKKRYPEISKFKKRFYSYFNSLKVDKSIHIEVPQNFEKWEFKINFSFKDLKEFKEKLAKIQLISKKREFKSFLKMRY